MLTSAEVGTLITALGCGIGREEFNPDKLRYHRIIVMTDADVDGSHIRTLLLTFFYRQMPELIERGHIYIAQPPLYKIKKGKQERYIKDDNELNKYLLQTALENANLFVNSDTPPIVGSSLESLADNYLVVMATIDRLSKRYNPLLLEKMIYMPPFSAEAMQSKEQTEAWFNELEKRLSSEDMSAEGFKITIEPDSESNYQLAKIVALMHGVESETFINYTFFNSGEYRSMLELGEKIKDLLGVSAFIQRGDRKMEVSSFKQALNWLMEEAKRGQHIQRYKGLGEMNPDQLWETTMNSETRRLLRVQIEDAVASDEVFTTLMGDQVEPRRDFIEKNALNVANLDI